jgi:hypothetical protein
MRKKTPSEEWPEVPFISSTGSKSTKLRAAIETVFRLTHRRDMTEQERRLFGLPAINGDHATDGKSSSTERHSTNPRRRT